MFPDSLHLPTTLKGKVFAVRETPSGGVAAPDRTVEIDVEEWDDCQRCSEFESCYKLCLGKVTLESAISGT
jgi:hypothetical protein